VETPVWPLKHDVDVFQINIKNIVQYLKKSYPETNNWTRGALMHRTALHYLSPRSDPMLDQVYDAYEKLAEELNKEKPRLILDLCCMCGYLKYFLELNTDISFSYTGIDNWQAAIDVARRWHPRTHFMTFDVLDPRDWQRHHQGYVGSYDVAVITNVSLPAEAVINAAKKYAPVLYAGMPKNRGCDDFAEAAKKMELQHQFWDCGKSTLTRIILDGNYDIRGASDSS